MTVLQIRNRYKNRTSVKSKPNILKSYRQEQKGEKPCLTDNERIRYQIGRSKYGKNFDLISLNLLPHKGSALLKRYFEHELRENHGKVLSQKQSPRKREIEASDLVLPSSIVQSNQLQTLSTMACQVQMLDNVNGTTSRQKNTNERNVIENKNGKRKRVESKTSKEKKKKQKEKAPLQISSRVCTEKSRSALKVLGVASEWMGEDKKMGQNKNKQSDPDPARKITTKVAHKNNTTPSVSGRENDSIRSKKWQRRHDKAILLAAKRIGSGGTSSTNVWEDLVANDLFSKESFSAEDVKSRYNHLINLFMKQNQ
mmetsp:Transcript_1531/g.1967  ORF Transcript_1531/g.1967 Transcript_1531/m.1967 type:complete len:312 (-) Transcript_1531:1522-2457(-)